MHRLVGSLVCRNGRGLSRTGARAAADRSDVAARGNPVPPDAGQGPEAARRSDRGYGEAGDVLPGETAFKLYDTFGFPYDLTEDALRAQGFGIDRAGFETAMARTKSLARAAWKGSARKRRTKSGSTSPNALVDRIHRLHRQRRRRPSCGAGQ